MCCPSEKQGRHADKPSLHHLRYAERVLQIGPRRFAPDRFSSMDLPTALPSKTTRVAMPTIPGTMPTYLGLKSNQKQKNTNYQQSI
jgi:hypothetical protein